VKPNADTDAHTCPAAPGWHAADDCEDQGRSMSKWLRILFAFLSGAVAATITVVVGVVTPILIMDWIYGSKQVEESPGGGGAIVIASFPLSCLVAVAVFAVFSRFAYRRLSA
jgi:uncharacterized BrkB/YihY/UPF0761 family membrane protein